MLPCLLPDGRFIEKKINPLYKNDVLICRIAIWKMSPNQAEEFRINFPA